MNKYHSLKKEHYIRSFGQIYKEAERLRSLLNDEMEVSKINKIEYSKMFCLNMIYETKILELEAEIKKLRSKA